MHEPKGVASASVDTVYVADGAGSGSWKAPTSFNSEGASDGMVLRANGSGGLSWVYPPQGYGFYVHNGSPQVLNTTYSKVVIDGNGTTSDSNYLPKAIRGVGELWDNVTNKITPIAMGDSYEMRLDLPVTSESGSVTDITIQLDIGGGASPTIPIVTRAAIGGKSTPYIISVAFPLFSGATFLANGGQLFVKTNVGSIAVSGAQLYVGRTGAGDF